MQSAGLMAFRSGHPVLDHAMLSNNKSIPSKMVVGILLSTARTQEAETGQRLAALDELSRTLLGDRKDDDLSAAAVTASWSGEEDDPLTGFIKDNLKV